MGVAKSLNNLCYIIQCANNNEESAWEMLINHYNSTINYYANRYKLRFQELYFDEEDLYQLGLEGLFLAIKYLNESTENEIKCHNTIETFIWQNIFKKLPELLDTHIEEGRLRKFLEIIEYITHYVKNNNAYPTAEEIMLTCEISKEMLRDFRHFYYFYFERCYTSQIHENDKNIPYYDEGFNINVLDEEIIDVAINYILKGNITKVARFIILSRLGFNSSGERKTDDNHGKKFYMTCNDVAEKLVQSGLRDNIVTHQDIHEMYTQAMGRVRGKVERYIED